jgi:spore coat protein U-like protein
MYTLTGANSDFGSGVEKVVIRLSGVNSGFDIEAEVVVMKKLLIIAAVALMVIVTAGSALAAGSVSETVAVSGTVSGKCKVGANGVMAFTIDPELAGPIAAAVTTDATVFCTNSLPFTVTALSTNKGGSAASCASSGSGITGTLKDGSNVMDYTYLYVT